jgi:hypothetical protein
MPKTLRKEQLKLYKDPKVQLLISKFVSEELDILNPIYEPKKGLRYPIIDEILLGSSNTEKFLQKMFEGGILKRRLCDKIVYCPSCISANLSLHYTCPHCKSFDIKKSSLIEHIKCGYIDTEDHFQKGDKLVCPKCNKEFTHPEVDYHKAGVWCTCNQCEKSFDIPVPNHFCRQCHQNFTFDEAIFKNVYSYSLTPEAAQEATSSFVLTIPIIKFLENHGYKVESPGFLNGKSGTRHKFDFAAVFHGKKNDITVIDIATSTDDVVSEHSVIAMFAKIFDANPNRACLVAIPKMSESGKKLAKLYKIDLVEAKNQRMAIDSLKSCLS